MKLAVINLAYREEVQRLKRSLRGDETDPVRPLTGSARVVRGGYWGNYAHRVHSLHPGATTFKRV